jgi:hypothetical protein
MYDQIDWCSRTFIIIPLTASLHLVSSGLKLNYRISLLVSCFEFLKSRIGCPGDSSGMTHVFHVFVTVDRRYYNSFKQATTARATSLPIRNHLIIYNTTWPPNLQKASFVIYESRSLWIYGLVRTWRWPPHVPSVLSIIVCDLWRSRFLGH